MTTEPEIPKAWLLLTHQSSKGRTYSDDYDYKDNLSECYVFDSFVPNHKRIAVGDIVLLRDKEYLLGVGRIESKQERSSYKTRLRCPQCHKSDIPPERKTHPFKFRCRHCEHEFNVPEQTLHPCKEFTIYYKQSFLEVKKNFSLAKINQIINPKPNPQHSMQRIDNLEELIEVLQKAIPELNELINLNNSPILDHNAINHQKSYISSEESDSDYNRIESPNIIMRQIKERRGQQKFRQSLRQIHHDQCMVTGCNIPDILEAAHIFSYSRDHNNHITNGLLLRADIHTLFDLDLLGIQPHNLTIYLHPSVKNDDYAQYEGKRLACDIQLNQQALESRWQSFQYRLRN